MYARGLDSSFGASECQQRRRVTKNARTTWFWPFMVMLCAGPSVLGQPASFELPRVWAVLVGVERYDHASIPGRPLARSDAISFFRFFNASAHAGTAPERVLLLADEPQVDKRQLRATAQTFRETMQLVANQAASEDVLILFVKGSGVPHQGEFRWLFSDSNPERFPETSILSTELHELLRAVKCHRVVSLVDMSFEAAAAPLGLTDQLAHANWSKLFEAIAGDGRFVVSINDGRLAADVPKDASNGYLTRLILQGLAGAADGNEQAPDSWITAAELWSYLNKNLPARDETEQRTTIDPKLFGAAVVPEIRLARNPDPGVLRKVQENLEKLASLHRAGVIDHLAFDEGNRVLVALPTLPVDRRLRAAFLEFLDNSDPDALNVIRREVAAERQIPEGEADAFAATVLDSWQLIERHYVLPQKGNSALAEGLWAILRQLDIPVSTEIRDQLRQVPLLGRAELSALVKRIRLQIGRREDFSSRQLLDVCLAAMSTSLDPHSSFMKELEQNTPQDSHYAGIGIQLKPAKGTDGIVISTPLLDSPAFRAGIRSGDRILAINGTPAAELTIEDAFAKLAGERGQPVRLRVARDAAPEPRDLELVREQVQVESVVGLKRGPDYQWDHWLDEERRIAYFRIKTFAEDTAEQLRRKLRQLHRSGLTGIVLDLRSNPGGLLEAAVDVADLFLERGQIVEVRYRDGQKKVYSASRFGTYPELALVVLINRFSASGSEIVAASMQDHERGIVIGERSFGKGSVQKVFDLPNQAGQLRLTVASFHRPSGENLHRFPHSPAGDPWGVQPTQGFLIPLFREQIGQIEHAWTEQESIRSGDQPAPEFSIDGQLGRAIAHLRSAPLPPTTNTKAE